MIGVHNTGVLADGTLNDINGTATAAFPDEPGHLLLQFPGGTSQIIIHVQYLETISQTTEINVTKSHLQYLTVITGCSIPTIRRILPFTAAVLSQVLKLSMPG